MNYKKQKPENNQPALLIIYCLIPDTVHPNQTIFILHFYSWTREKSQKGDLIILIPNLKAFSDFCKIKIVQLGFWCCCFYTWPLCPPSLAHSSLSWALVVRNFFKWLLCVLFYPTSPGHTVPLAWDIFFSIFHLPEMGADNIKYWRNLLPVQGIQIEIVNMT